jgi:predicted KAP-like P-loop ATPase
MTAGNLRNRVYILEEHNEIMRTGLEDIQRMDPEGRMGWYAKTVLDTVDGK